MILVDTLYCHMRTDTHGHTTQYNMYTKWYSPQTEIISELIITLHYTVFSTNSLSYTIVYSVYPRDHSRLTYWLKLVHLLCSFLML